MAEHDESLSCPHEHTTPQEPEGNPPSASRRRFVAGISFSLPAIATLYHGAVLAQTSSTRCLENRTGNPIAGQNHLRNAPAANPGDYATSEVSIRTYTNSGNSTSKTYYFDPLTNIWRRAENGLDTIAADETSLDALAASEVGTPYTKTSGSSYAVAYIDNNGDVKALGDTTMGRYLPATFSCWTSAV